MTRRATSLLGATLLIGCLVAFGIYISLATPNDSSSTFSGSTQTTEPQLGLEFWMSVNPTVIRSGDSIEISMSIRNTLTSMNNVSRSSEWQLSPLLNWTASSSLCPKWDNFVIFTGYYARANISQATNSLVIVAPNPGLVCPNRNYNTYFFEPMSSLASLNYLGNVMNMNESSVVMGYYHVEVKSVSPFANGTYTIAGGDEWGQLDILHFRVV